MRQEHGYWRRHVLAHRRSGVTQTAYCLHHGLHPKTFRTWCRRLEVEGNLAPASLAADEAGVVEGVEELAYPFLHSGSRDGVQASDAPVVPVQRQLYSDAEKRQFVMAALQSGLPIERYARMAGLTPSALHRWKHKFAIHMGLLPAAPAPSPPGFAAVVVGSSATGAAPGPDPATVVLKAAIWNSVEIALDNGRRLTVDVRVDSAALRRLPAVLEPSA